MSIDVSLEVTFVLSDGKHHLPGRPSWHKLNNYRKHGVRSVSGKIVKLDCILGPSGWETSREAYDRFKIALNDGGE